MDRDTAHRARAAFTRWRRTDFRYFAVGAISFSILMLVSGLRYLAEYRLWTPWNVTQVIVLSAFAGLCFSIMLLVVLRRIGPRLAQWIGRAHDK